MLSLGSATPRVREHAQMESTTNQRHKTAIRRGAIFRPVKCLLRDGLLSNEATFFE
jgi:hypothetical protein